jgi:ribosomal protein S18 acetylase RimI-like enzyme
MNKFQHNKKQYKSCFVDICGLIKLMKEDAKFSSSFSELMCIDKPNWDFGKNIVNTDLSRKEQTYYQFILNKSNVVGYVRVITDKKVRKINSVVISPVNRGQGLCQKLVSLVLNNTEAQSILSTIKGLPKSATLSVDVKNIAAIKCYEKLGFKGIIPPIKSSGETMMVLTVKK